MKPSSVIFTALAAASLASVAPEVGAQATGTWRVSPEPNRRAFETPPKPREPEFGSSPKADPAVFRRQPLAFVMIPAILMSDGTVLANFGMGYEPVTRSCGGAVVVGSQPTVVGSNGRTLSRPSPTTPGRTRPLSVVPQQSQARFPILTAASQASCFTTDGAGHFFVVRQ